MIKPHRLLIRAARSYARKKWPIATCLLVGICVAVFAFQIVYPEEVWEKYAFVPAEARSRPWTFVTSTFLHSGLDHLMLNLIGLAIFGYAVEVKLGGRNLLTVFFCWNPFSSGGHVDDSLLGIVHRGIGSHLRSLGISCGDMPFLPD